MKPQREGDQQLPAKTDGESIQRMVIADVETAAFMGTASTQEAVKADIAERERVGIERYGTTLQAHNGRDVGRDAYEEMLDLVMYLKQGIAEGRQWNTIYWQTLRGLVAFRPHAVTAAGDAR